MRSRLDCVENAIELHNNSATRFNSGTQNLAAVNYSIFHSLQLHRRVQSIKLKVQQEAPPEVGVFEGLGEK